MISSAMLDTNRGGTSDLLKSGLAKSIDEGNMAFLGIPVVYGSPKRVAEQFDQMCAAFDIAEVLEHFLAPARADRDADEFLEVRRDRWTQLIRARIGDGFHVANFHVEIHGQAQPHIVDRLTGLARVAGVARRIDGNRLHSSELRLDIVGQQLTGRRSVRLTATEFVLLKTLAQAPAQRAATFQLLQATQREVDDKAKASLEVQLVNLRKKIQQAGYDKPAIRAIRNEGYRLLCRVLIG